MHSRQIAAGETSPAIRRLESLADLGPQAREVLATAAERRQMVKGGRELVGEHQEYKALILLSGWAARVRLLQDGRRQLLGLFLPGDVIGCCDLPAPVATCAIMTLTASTICVAPVCGLPDLERAYALSRALDEAFLLAQIARLGRMDAREKLSDFLLELNERLVPSGLSHGGRFTLPLTQELLADALGLTAVHVNRTLQIMRRDGDIVWNGGEMILRNPAQLAKAIGRAPIVVSVSNASARFGSFQPGI